jgi:hypothetical protein
MYINFINPIQSDFESCADILTFKRRHNNSTYVPYTNVNGLQENQRNQFVWEPLKIFKFSEQF